MHAGTVCEAHERSKLEDLLLAVNGPSVWTMQLSDKDYYAGLGAERLEQQAVWYTSGLRIYDVSIELLFAHLEWILCFDRITPTGSFRGE